MYVITRGTSTEAVHVPHWPEQSEWRMVGIQEADLGHIEGGSNNHDGTTMTGGWNGSVTTSWFCLHDIKLPVGITLNECG